MITVQSINYMDVANHLSMISQGRLNDLEKKTERELFIEFFEACESERPMLFKHWVRYVEACLIDKPVYMLQ